METSDVQAMIDSVLHLWQRRQTVRCQTSDFSGVATRRFYKMRPKAATDLAFLIGGRWREAPDDGTPKAQYKKKSRSDTSEI